MSVADGARANADVHHGERDQRKEDHDEDFLFPRCWRLVCSPGPWRKPTRLFARAASTARDAPAARCRGHDAPGIWLPRRRCRRGAAGLWRSLLLSRRRPRLPLTAKHAQETAPASGVRSLFCRRSCVRVSRVRNRGVGAVHPLLVAEVAVPASVLFAGTMAFVMECGTQLAVQLAAELFPGQLGERGDGKRY